MMLSGPMKRVVGAVVVPYAFGLFSFPSTATARASIASDARHTSANFCAQHPELFKVRHLRPDEAMAFIYPTGEHMTIIGFERGRVISGPCTRFIKTFGNGIVLTNNAAFGIDGSALFPAPKAEPNAAPPSHFVPSRNVMFIASDKFAEGSGRTYVKHQGNIVLWSGKSGSAIGTVSCAGEGSLPCRLDHLLLSSPYRIRNFGFVPSPHTEMHVGELSLQIALPRGDEASVNYSISWWENL